MLSHAALEATSMSLREKISRSTTAYVNLRAQNLPLQFYMSTLTGIVDLVEDEIIPTPIPMEVSQIIELGNVYLLTFQLLLKVQDKKGRTTQSNVLTWYYK